MQTATTLLAGMLAIVILFRGPVRRDPAPGAGSRLHREIGDRLLAPLPAWAVALEKIALGTIQGLLAALVIFPLAIVTPAAPPAFSSSTRPGRRHPPARTEYAAGSLGPRRCCRVEVTDRSGPGAPALRPAGDDAEAGRGLGLVAGLAARWGWRRRGGRTVTWFEQQYG